jgi:uncharacterized membrane protein
MAMKNQNLNPAVVALAVPFVINGVRLLLGYELDNEQAEAIVNTAVSIIGVVGLFIHPKKKSS